MEEMSKRHDIVAALAICSGIYIFPASLTGNDQVHWRPTADDAML